MTQHDSIQYIQCICYNKEQQRERENRRKTSFSIKNVINKILNIRYSATSQTIITQPTNDKTSHLICPSRWRAILLILQCLSPSLSATMGHGSKLRPVKSKTRVKDRDRQRIMNNPVPWEPNYALSEPFIDLICQLKWLQDTPACKVLTQRCFIVHIYLERSHKRNTFSKHQSQFWT